ncbi:MAG TPA: hypothetical protein VKA10_08200 [Prolixibacteraceae bacterium]|nr:hypothetical protein [Prolixibacteraceae bacterium]
MKLLQSFFKIAATLIDIQLTLYDEMLNYLLQKRLNWEPGE